MKKLKIILAITILLTATYKINSSSIAVEPLVTTAEALQWERSPFFNTEVVDSPHIVIPLLQEAGFEHVRFPAPERAGSDRTLMLEGMYLNRGPDATSSIVIAAGFCWGRMTGMATFYKIFWPNVNMLFFNARGHGASEGLFGRNLLHYTEDEYNDIAGAVEYLYTLNGKPIILFGICSGAVHALRCVTEKGEDWCRTRDIRGVIADSAWSSVEEASRTAITGQIKKLLTGAFKTTTRVRNRRRIENWWLFKIANWSFATTYLTTHKLFLSRYGTRADGIIQLPESIAGISVPPLFIHSLNDTFSRWDNLQPILEAVPEKFKADHPPLLFDESTHACHHLRHKVPYAKSIRAYCDTILKNSVWDEGKEWDID